MAGGKFKEGFGMFKKNCIAMGAGILCMVSSMASAAGPEIIDFSPKKGSSGDNIVIKGKNLIFANLSSNKIKFGSKPADVSMMSQETGSLVVTVPKGAIPAPISLLNSNGAQAFVTQDAFEVIPGSGEIASSGTKLGVGDRVHFKAYMAGFSDTATNKLHYAPPEATAWIDRIDGSKAYVVFTKNWTDANVGTGVEDADYKKIADGGMVKQQREYSVDVASLRSGPLAYRGFDYGVLLAPYKFHPQDRSLTGEATLGGYLGYRYTWPGVAVTIPVLSAGLGVVNVQKDSTTNETKSSPSFSIAGGAIFSFFKNGLFQLGLLGGADWAGKGSIYKYEGQPWFAVSFGINLTK
jgi:hypothetical protein